MKKFPFIPIVKEISVVGIFSIGSYSMEYWDGIAKINLLGTLSERILSIQVRVGKRVKTKRA